MSILFSNATVVTMDDAQPVLEKTYVSVRDGKIAAVSATRPSGSYDRVVNCAGKVLMPGLVNAHTHLPMTLMRGFAGGHNLQDWLNNYIFPTEDKLDSRSIRAGTGLALAELIASGTTTVADMYYFCDDIIDEVIDAGVNANIARGVTCFAPCEDPANYPPCQELAAVAERWNGHNNGQIKVDASIHGEYTSYNAPKLWEYLARFAADHGLGMHVHLSETKSEHEECIGRHGMTPLQVLDQYGVFARGGLAAHCVWCSQADYELMAKRGVTAVHNPVSNLKLGSGVANVPAMQRAGVNVALGTDGMSSNNSHDLFEEIKLTAILHKGTQLDPMVVTPWETLKMATVNGAKALGRKAGVVAPGYDADLILLDFDRPHLIPCHDVVENLVFATRGSDVVMNMARGKVIYENGRYFTLDLSRIKSEVSKYALPKLFD
jgi:5-methylthioadenosine/S-adenosylhomocysteine deaminase